MKGSKFKNLLRSQLQTNSSYYGKYAQKTKISHGMIHKMSNNQSMNKSETDINVRREQIMNVMQKNKEPSIIRIEDSMSNGFYNVGMHAQSESMWLAKIAQVNQKLEKVSKKIIDEQKLTSQRQRELQEKKARYAASIEKNNNFSKRMQEQIITEEPEDSQHSPQTAQIKSKQKQLEEDINSLKQDKQQLSQQVQHLQAELAYLQNEYKRLESSQETEQTVEDLNELIQENERIQQRIAKMQLENLELEQKINQLQKYTTHSDDFYKRIIQRQEKVHINKELQKIEKLMLQKKQYLLRKNDLQRKKSLPRQKQIEISLRQKIIKDKQKISRNLKAKIDQLSMQMLQGSYKNMK